MTGPRLGQGMPVDDGWIARQLADLQRQIVELRAARTLDSSTVSPNGKLTIAGSLEVTGNTIIDGTLSLPNASVNDDALANPVSFVVVDTTGGADMPVGPAADVLTQTIPVPAGFSKAFIQVTGTSGLIPNGSSPNNLGGYVYCSQDAIQSNEQTVAVAASAFGFTMSTLGMSASGLTGGTFTISQYAFTSASVPTSSAQHALAGLVVFLR